MSDNSPPSAVDVEKRLLGAVINSEDAAHDMVEVLEGDYKKFYSGRHQRIAYAIMALLDEGDPVDLITVTQKLKSMGELENVGGSFYVTDLTTEAGVETSVQKYSRIIVEKWLLRETGDTGRRIVEEAQDETNDAFEVLEGAQQKILDIGIGDSTDAGRIEATAEERMKQHVESTRLRRTGKSPLTGVPTGFSRIDDLTGGFGDQELIIIAARPSMGKSAWALGQAMEAAQNDFSSAIFSLEMAKSEWFDRGVGYLSEVNMQKVARGYGSDQELLQAYRASQKMKDLPLWVIDDPGITLSGIRAKARRLVRTEDVDQIIIDYLQLIGAKGSYGTREQEVAYISRQMKVMAKDLDVPVIALSQLNRKSLSRGGGKRPDLSDLRESGAIEQDADLVGFIHRPERLDIEQHDLLGVPSEGLADFIVSKQRNGPIGTVFMKFVKEYAKFEPMDLKAEFEGTADVDEEDEYKSATPNASIPAWAHNLLDEDVKEEQASHETEDTPEDTKAPQPPPLPGMGDGATEDEENLSIDEDSDSDSALGSEPALNVGGDGTPDEDITEESSSEETSVEDPPDEEDGPDMEEDDTLPF